METSLYDQILVRLLSDESLDPLVTALVDAACEGSLQLEQALQGTGITREVPNTKPVTAQLREPPGAYLDTITVAGFRGAGPEATLSIPPGPGLTLVVGRNGSGKSTFAEALETLLTGECGRWSAARTKLWRQGWRNLHGEGPPRVSASLVVEGGPAIRLTRTWSGNELSQCELSLEGAESLEGLGWASALTEFRPFISNPELGALVAEPSEVFDQLHRVLGLDDMTTAVGLLASQRKPLEVRAKAVKERRGGLAERARTLTTSDARAERISTLLGKRKIELDELEAVVLGDPESGRADSEHRTLRTLTNLRLPPLDEWGRISDELRKAATELDAATAESAADHAALAQLLELSLPLVQRHPTTCPVCEQPIRPHLGAMIEERAKQSKELAARFEHAKRALGGARQAASSLVERVPQAAIVAAEALGLAEGLGAQVVALKSLLEADARELADRLAQAAPAVVEAADRVREQAADRLRAIDDTFKPLQRDLVAWLGDARREEGAAPYLEALKAAEKWLQRQQEQLRDERFLPIASQVREIWQMLGQQSAVTLDSVQLAGKGTRRRLELGVSVEGAGAAAIGVMSQGELNALALSLFLPRMMLSESPFRFLVIDDPVQAMDPVKIDGLARALQNVADKRQVVVFTHDPRLVEAVQRLQVAATVLEVTRRARSTVEVRPIGNAIQQYLADARHVAYTTASMGEELVSRVVPGFCRSAIEAACLQVVRRRRLGRGDNHEDVEGQVQPSPSLLVLLSLALFDTPDKAADVLRDLNQGSRPRGGANTVQAVKAGAHGKYAGDVLALVRDTERLTEYLVGLS